MGLKNERREANGPLTESNGLPDSINEPYAVLIRSAEHGFIWLVPDEAAVEELRAELDVGEPKRPIFTFSEATHLVGKSRATLDTIIAFKSVFSDGRLTG